LALSAVLSAVENKLESLPIPVRLTMPDGSVVGAANARVSLVIKDNATLANLATGQVGVLGEDGACRRAYRADSPAYVCMASLDRA
jgi:cyclopropane-fatty-acyl-phospholipid synthase